MSNVIRLVPDELGANAHVAANRVLASARRAKLDTLVVIGYRPDGEIYIAGTDGPGESLLALERAKQTLIA